MKTSHEDKTHGQSKERKVFSHKIFRVLQRKNLLNLQSNISAKWNAHDISQIASLPELLSRLLKLPGNRKDYMRVGYFWI